MSRVLALTPAAAVAPRTRAGSWLLQRQGYLFFPLLLLEGVNLHAAGLRVLASRRDLKHRRLEASIVLARLATCVTIVFVVLPPAKALTFLAVQQGLFGVLLGGAFAPNHKGMPIVPADCVFSPVTNTATALERIPGWAPTGTLSMTSTTSRSTRRAGAFAGTPLEAETSSAVADVHRSVAVDGTRGGAGAERRDGRALIRQVSTYADLSRRVQDAGLLARRRAWYWQRMIGAATAFVMIWVAFFLLGDSWLQMGLAGLLAVVTAQFGFLGHDAAHRQIFVSVRWNEWSARLLSAVFAGLSYRFNGPARLCDSASELPDHLVA